MYELPEKIEATVYKLRQLKDYVSGYELTALREEITRLVDDMLRNLDSANLQIRTMIKIEDDKRWPEDHQVVS